MDLLITNLFHSCLLVDPDIMFEFLRAIYQYAACDSLVGHNNMFYEYLILIRYLILITLSILHNKDL